MSPKNLSAPPIWFARQRVIRTVIQGVIGALPTVVAIVGILNDTWPAAWLAATLALGVAIQGALAKIMALPGVNDWLTTLGAGSVPASEVDSLARQATADRDAAAAREALRADPNTEY